MPMRRALESGMNQLADAVAAAAEPASSDNRSRKSFMPTIALVDDDRNILTSVSIALEAEGYRIMTYTDGASALDGFKTSAHFAK